jgi:peptide/nickel transport system permease protein
MARYGEDVTDSQMVDKVREQEGLNQPLASRYLGWMGNTLRLDLGRSLISGEPVIQEVWFHFGKTCQLAGWALAISLLAALPLGVLGGLKPGSFYDGMASALSSMLVALPGFVLGSLLILGFTIKLGWLPAAGFTSPAHVVLPALTLSLGLAAVSNRVIRTAVASVKNSYYLTFARLKGLPARRIFWGHTLRNLAAPVVTFLGLQLAHLMDGAVVVENLFDWPGLGYLLLEAINSRNIPVIQAATLLIGLVYVLVNLMVDLVCHWLDPRQRASEASL